MTTVTLSTKNQVVVPLEARRALGLKPGDKIAFVVKGDRVIVIEKAANPEPSLRGLAGPLKFARNHVRKERDSWD